MPRRRPHENYEHGGKREIENESINCCQLDVHKALIRERHSSKRETPPVDLFSKRSCTDILCLFVFFFAVIAWIVLSVFVYMNGGPEKLLAPVDSNNRRCGFDKGVEDRPNLFFFDLTKCLPPRGNFFRCDTKQVCVSECPKINFSASDIRNYMLDTLKENLICVDEFNKYSKIKSYEDVTNALRRGYCAGWYMESEETLRLCFPLELSTTLRSLTFGALGRSQGANADVKAITHKLIRSRMNELKQSKGFFHRVGEDILRSWQWIVAFMFLAMIFSFIFVIIMRWISSLMVWLSLVVLLGLLTFSSVYTWKNYKEAKDESKVLESPAASLFARFPDELKLLKDDLLKHEYTWLALFILSVASLIIILIILLFLRSRINLAIQLIKEGSKAVSYAWTSLIFPAFPWILQLAAFVQSALIFCFLMGERVPIFRVTGLNNSGCACTNGYMEGDICGVESFKRECHDVAGNPCLTAKCAFSESEAESYTIYLHLFNLLMFLWSEYFISGFSQMSLAMTFATYYWTNPKRKLPFCIVGTSIIRVVQYHLGTIAFGSLLLALLNWIRILVEIFYRYINKNDNSVVRCLRCCCGCLLACLHKILRILTKNAYIMCAMKGSSYCASAKHAFDLIVRNVIRASVLDGVTTFLFFLMKLVITISVGVAYYFFVSPINELKDLTKDDYEFDYYFVPILIVCLAAFLISSLFFGVYSSAVDTIFLCALEDLDKNDGTPERPYVMSKSLIKIFKVKNRKPSAVS